MSAFFFIVSYTCMVFTDLSPYRQGASAAQVFFLRQPVAFSLQHDEQAMFLLLEGRTTISTSENDYEIGPLQFLLLDRHTKGKVQIKQHSKLVFISAPDLIDAVKCPHHSMIDLLYGRITQITPPLRTFIYKIEKAVEVKLNDAYWLQAELAGLAGIFAHMLGHAVDEMNRIQAGKESTRKQLYKQILAARDYIDLHFAEDLTINKIAREVALSEFHFSRHFKSVVGKAPYQYIKEQRAMNAMSILTTDAPIQSINEVTGFESLHSFSTFCKTNMGLSPTQLRNSYRSFIQKLAGLKNQQNG